MAKRNKYLLVATLIIILILGIFIISRFLNPISPEKPEIILETEEESYFPEITTGDTIEEIEQDLESLTIDDFEEIDSLDEEAEEI